MVHRACAADTGTGHAFGAHAARQAARSLRQRHRLLDAQRDLVKAVARLDRQVRHLQPCLLAPLVWLIVVERARVERFRPTTPRRQVLAQQVVPDRLCRAMARADRLDHRGRTADDVAAREHVGQAGLQRHRISLDPAAARAVQARNRLF